MRGNGGLLKLKKMFVLLLLFRGFFCFWKLESIVSNSHQTVTSRRLESERFRHITETVQQPDVAPLHINTCIKCLVQPFKYPEQQYVCDTVLLNTNPILRQFSPSDRFTNFLYNNHAIRNLRLDNATATLISLWSLPINTVPLWLTHTLPSTPHLNWQNHHETRSTNCGDSYMWNLGSAVRVRLYCWLDTWLVQKLEHLDKTVENFWKRTPLSYTPTTDTALFNIAR